MVLARSQRRRLLHDTVTDRHGEAERPLSFIPDHTRRHSFPSFLHTRSHAPVPCFQPEHARDLDRTRFVVLENLEGGTLGDITRDLGTGARPRHRGCVRHVCRSARDDGSSSRPGRSDARRWSHARRAARRDLRGTARGARRGYRTGADPRRGVCAEEAEVEDRRRWRRSFGPSRATGTSTPPTTKPPPPCKRERVIYRHRRIFDRFPRVVVVAPPPRGAGSWRCRTARC